MPLFAVVNAQGPNWQADRPMRSQSGWDDHARFMDQLDEEGVIVLGGPLAPDPPHRALLILRGESRARLRDRLAEDPWMRSGVLELGELWEWELLLGTLRSDALRRVAES